MATENKKQEFKMEQAFALWKNKSKDGKTYFTGETSMGDRLIGFYVTDKKNPKEPDLRVYKMVKEDGKDKIGDIFTSLWCNVGKNDKKYLTGILNEKRLVGFINDKAKEKQPSISVYYSIERVEGKPVQAVPKNDVPFEV